MNNVIKVREREFAIHGEWKELKEVAKAFKMLGVEDMKEYLEFPFVHKYDYCLGIKDKYCIGIILYFDCNRNVFLKVTYNQNDFSGGWSGEGLKIEKNVMVADTLDFDICQKEVECSYNSIITFIENFREFVKVIVPIAVKGTDKFTVTENKIEETNPFDSLDEEDIIFEDIREFLNSDALELEEYEEVIL